MSPALKRSQRWRIVATIASVVALAALIFTTRDQIGDTLGRFGEINSWALFLIIPLQTLNYYAYTGLYRSTFTILGQKLPFFPMMRVALEVNFVNNIFPSGGVSGFSYFGIRMRDFDVPAARATVVQMMRFVMAFTSFQLLLFIGLFLLALEGNANDLMILIAGSLATLLLVGALIGGYIVGSQRRINAFFSFFARVVNRVFHRFRRGTPEIINLARAEQVVNDLHDNYLIIRRNLRAMKRPLFYSFLANSSEVFCIYVTYVAFGEWVNPGAVIIAYAVANFAGLISFLPGGIGIYESLMTAVMLGAGVPPAVSLPVTLMYRIITMLLQLPIGSILYYRSLHGGSKNAKNLQKNSLS